MFSLQLVRYATDTKLNISALLMAPVQRVTRYPLLLDTINNLCEKGKAVALKEGKSLTVEQKKKAFYVKEALDLSHELTTYVNDMMEAGKILHYQVYFLLWIYKKSVLFEKLFHNRIISYHFRCLTSGKRNNGKRITNRKIKCVMLQTGS